jgi:hypothetical protein
VPTTDDDLEASGAATRVLVHKIYPNDHLQLAWSAPRLGWGPFCSSASGKQLRDRSHQDQRFAVVVRRRLSRCRTALFTSVLMFIGLLISYGIVCKFGWQTGLGVVAVMYAFITAVQASTWLVDKVLNSGAN